MEFTKQVIVNVISSTVVLGLFLFVARKYLEKWISSRFDIRANVASHKIDQAFRVSGFYMEKEMGIYPEILEVTHRLRNIMRDGIQKSHAYEWNPQLRPLCVHLTENLFKYSLFISQEIFDALHTFKEIMQDVVIFRDVYTRTDRLFNKDEYHRELRGLEAKYKEADRLYCFISASIRERINSMSRV